MLLCNLSVQAAETKGNGLCYVCHGDLRTEKITTTHEKVGVGCTVCHGSSTVHMQDEMLMTKPDLLFGRQEVEQMCTACHEKEQTHTDKAKVEAFRKKWTGKISPNGRAINADSVCTDCHGTHNIVKEEAGQSQDGQSKKWEAMFNGSDLSGWRQAGDADWTVKRGRIVAAAGRKAKGGILLSEAVYEDFLLSMTFRAEWPVKAAIMLRTETGRDGPRVEIFEDRKPAAYTGTISLAGKGRLLLNIRQDLVDKGGWNTISVQARGDRFAVWLNGEEIGAVRLPGPAKGRIALQIQKHPKNKNAELTISEILVQQSGSEQQMTPLFNGTDLAGWEAEGGARWFVENGELVGIQGPGNAPGDLFTKDSYKDFLVKVTYRVEWPCNSGLWFRYQSPDKAYQADILEYKKPECYSGTLYCPGKMFLAMNTDKSLVDRLGWNTIIVRAQGDHLQIWLNDRQIADVHDDTSEFGRIGFQVHPGDGFAKMKIVVREAMIKSLD